MKDRSFNIALSTFPKKIVKIHFDRYKVCNSVCRNHYEQHLESNFKSTSVKQELSAHSKGQPGVVRGVGKDYGIEIEGGDITGISLIHGKF